MAQSMTGFANQTTTLGEWKLSFECKSVNSRFLDVTLKLPEALKTTEPQIRQAINNTLSRGKVELSIRLERDDSTPEAQVNTEKLLELEKALQTIRTALPETKAPSALDVLQMPGVWVAEKTDTDSLVASCLSCVPDLLRALVDHRESEGARLETMLKERCVAISNIVAAYRKELPRLNNAHQAKLRERIAALDAGHDEKRLEEELAYLANKSDVAEELDRLEAHIEAIYESLQSNEPCGRRLDFLMQELNREANTLGSKTTSLTTTNTAVELKVLIEQMREQVQNLE
ncbi:MAG: YicC family protein [Proteobacteria bacterium]|nr:MAG: YicC family protein [Pseudomonadota bacterium]